MNMNNMGNQLARLKTELSFVLTFISIIGSFALAFIKGTDVNTLVPTILGIYITNRSAQKMTSVLAASRDPNASTEEVVSMLEGKAVPVSKEDKSKPVDVLADIK